MLFLSPRRRFQSVLSEKNPDLFHSTIVAQFSIRDFQKFLRLTNEMLSGAIGECTEGRTDEQTKFFRSNPKSLLIEFIFRYRASL